MRRFSKPGAVRVLVLASALLGACSTRDAGRKEPEQPPAPSRPAAVAAPVNVAVSGAVATVTEKQSEGTVELRADQKLEVRLALQGTSRSTWRLVGFEPGVLRESGGARYEPDPVAAQYGEVAGTQIWRFEPAGPGRAQLRFELRVPQSREQPAAVATYAVSVR